MVDDPRSDELLAAHGRFYYRLNIALAWTDSLEGPGAKACSRTGRGAWKEARPFQEVVADVEAAAGYFVKRSRKANAVVPAGPNTFVLVEYDGDRDELDELHAVPPLPATLGTIARRGPHYWFRPPPGRPPLKVQIAPEGVTVSTDGYLVVAPAWRPDVGFVYERNETEEIARWV